MTKFYSLATLANGYIWTAHWGYCGSNIMICLHAGIQVLRSNATSDVQHFGPCDVSGDILPLWHSVSSAVRSWPHPQRVLPLSGQMNCTIGKTKFCTMCVFPQPPRPSRRIWYRRNSPKTALFIISTVSKNVQNICATQHENCPGTLNNLSWLVSIISQSEWKQIKHYTAFTSLFCQTWGFWPTFENMVRKKKHSWSSFPHC